MSNANGNHGPTDKRLMRKNRVLRQVPLREMKVAPEYQRELRMHWVDMIVNDFDIDRLQTPTISDRDGAKWIVDGQHRIEAIKRFLGNWEDQSLECWFYTGLTKKEEAGIFRNLNKQLRIQSFSDFRAGVAAGDLEETEIHRICTEERLIITQQAVPGGIRATNTLRRILRRDGPEALRRTLQICRDSYGAFDADILDGLGLLTHRHNGALDDQAAIISLSKAHGGFHGLLNLAQQLRSKTGYQKNHCVAAAGIQIINRDRPRKSRLPDWWKED